MIFEFIGDYRSFVCGRDWVGEIESGGAGIKGGACGSRDPVGRCFPVMGEPMAEAMGFDLSSFQLFGKGGRGGGCAGVYFLALGRPILQ